jgi:hypothetical protein
VYNDDDAAQTRILTIAVVKTTLLLPVIHGSSLTALNRRRSLDREGSSNCTKHHVKRGEYAHSHSHRNIYKTMQRRTSWTGVTSRIPGRGAGYRQ